MLPLPCGRCPPPPAARRPSRPGTAAGRGSVAPANPDAGWGGSGRPDRRRRTSAAPPGLRASLPLKMTSSIGRRAGSWRDCSPSTQVMASATLLLPQPLGPTMAVTPSSKASSARSENDLKPAISRRSRRMYGGSFGRVDRASASLAMPSYCGKEELTPQDFGWGPKTSSLSLRPSSRHRCWVQVPGQRGRKQAGTQAPGDLREGRLASGAAALVGGRGCEAEQLLGLAEAWTARTAAADRPWPGSPRRVGEPEQVEVDLVANHRLDERQVLLPGGLVDRQAGLARRGPGTRPPSRR